MSVADPAAMQQTAAQDASQDSPQPLNSSRLLQQLVSMRRPEPGKQGWDSIIHRDTMRRLMLALQHRDPRLVPHSRRVASLAVGVAQYLGWDGYGLQTLEAAGLLHDIGKIGIPDLILFKPGRLAPEETELMGLIYNIASDALQACGADDNVIDIITQAEHHFGSTMNDGPAGGEMHQGSRILAVADAYDSLVTPQVYREAHSHHEAMEILSRAAGSRFDGNVIAALTRWFDHNGAPDPGTQNGQQSYRLSPDEVVEAGTLTQAFSYLYLVESLYQGFYIVGPGQRIVVWNRGCERTSGVDWKQARKTDQILDLISYRSRFGEPLKDLEWPVVQAAQSGRCLTTELQTRRHDDQWLPVEVQTFPLFDDAGNLNGYAEIHRDLSGELESNGNRELKLMASRDALTHVANRGELKKQLDQLMASWIENEYASPFSVIFLDVDHFKKTNDTYGHAAGDEVLVSLARLLQHETYSGETIARYGGEEFVVLCPETGIDGAYQKAERLRGAIQEARVVQSDEFRITASFGVTEVERTDDADSVLQRADKALYMSKKSGRNRTSRLTAAQLKTSDPNLVEPPVETADQFVFQGQLRACIAADMIVYKLTAFVDGNGAKLGKVTADCVTMKLGQRSLVPFWGSAPEKQPVEIVLEFGTDKAQVQRGASRMVDIAVRITPIGWARDSEAFQVRARGIMKELREYFAADREDAASVN